jgi:hypothetical protein
MSDTTQVTEQCVIRWGAGVTAETREALLRKMAAIRPAKPHRDRAPNYARALGLAGGRGEGNLLSRVLAPDEPWDGSWMLRIYYESMGGDILCFEAGAMSSQAAISMERSATMALGVDRYRADQPGRIPPLWKGARRVTLPSQVRDPVVLVDPGPPECEAPLPLVEATPPPTVTPCAPCATEDTGEPVAAVVPPNSRVFNTYYAEMTAKRDARFQTYHRRSIAA